MLIRMITPLMFLQFSTAFKMQVADATGPQFQQYPFIPLYHLVVFRFVFQWVLKISRPDFVLLKYIPT